MVDVRTNDRQPARLRSLDGLRGVAALVVVFWHVSLTIPAVIFLDSAIEVGTSTWWWQLSPLKILSAGPEAVLIFFVLSGMVVTLPAIRRPEFDWVGYFPRRILRLYIPIAASIAFAAILIVLHRQVLGPEINYWVGNSSVSDLTPAIVFSSLDVFAPANVMNNPLWSLRWEFVFSLALPLFAAAAVLTGRWWPIGLAVSSVAVFVGYALTNSALMYLPLFYAGGLLAVHYNSLAAWASDLARRPRTSAAAWFLVLLGAGALLISNRMLLPVTVGHPLRSSLAMVAAFIGALLIVAVASLWQPAIRALSNPVISWLGRVSFSLYLVHVPILIFFANLFGPGKSALIAACTIPTALVVAELFARFVESPAHRFSKRFGRAVSAQFRAVSGQDLSEGAAARRNENSL